MKRTLLLSKIGFEQARRPSTIRIRVQLCFGPSVYALTNVEGEREREREGIIIAQAYLSSIQHKNFIPQQFMIDSSQRAWTRLIHNL